MQSPQILSLPRAHVRRHTTVAVGRLSDAEERALLARVPASSQWLRVGDLRSALPLVASRRIDRVALLQARPGELPVDSAVRLRSANPELEVLSLAGAWCEGELRTGKPIADVSRLYWHQLHEGFANERDASDSRVVLVNSFSYDNASAWIDVLKELGHSALWAPRGGAEPLHAGGDLAIWDGSQLSGREAAELAIFCKKRRVRDARVIAAFDFPRADTVATAVRLGAASVIGRPWSPEEVAAAIQAATKKDTRREAVIELGAAQPKAA